MRIPLVLLFFAAWESLVGADPPPEYPSPVMTYQGETPKFTSNADFTHEKPDVTVLTELVKQAVEEQRKVDGITESRVDSHSTGDGSGINLI